MHFILGHNQITKLMTLTIHLYRNHNKKTYFVHVYSVVVHTQNAVECRNISFGQPNFTYQCTCKQKFTHTSLAQLIRMSRVFFKHAIN